MTIIQAFQQELENEAVVTRKMLALVPSDKYQWKPHSKSMTLQQLATHTAELPTWIGMVLNTDELDFEAHPYSPKIIENTADLIAYFDASLKEGREEFKNADPSNLSKNWTLRNGEQIYTVETKYSFLRSTLSQIIHHRAQLGVYLRLLDIPIPGSYGPSADEHM
ncbi:DinB family protein [Sediminibacterium sp.]|uniref:DinB family protein n=1 Tax=Sediminibacterium sp. TaxID=1917865 RepID=UPI0025E10C32|nr:DinB family protein [Sediminibacterium sp.]MBW0177856.1 DinB family protein [Sediminibacterium sp.]